MWFVWSVFHICKLSWIIWESSEYDTILPLSRTGHQIFLIKSTFVLFCSLVWNLAHQNLNFFLFIVRFLGIFAHILSLKRLFHHNRNDGSEFLRYVIIYSCKTWYNVLIHSHVIFWGLGRFVGWGGQLTFWGRGVQFKRESLQILDLQKLPSPLTFELFLCSE